MTADNPAARVDLDALEALLSAHGYVFGLARGTICLCGHVPPRVPGALTSQQEHHTNHLAAILADRLAPLLAERDEARAERDALRERYAEAEWLLRMTYDARDRAERKVEAVEALADKYPAYGPLIRTALADPEAS
jgi:hypothetical protein